LARATARRRKGRTIPTEILPHHVALTNDLKDSAQRGIRRDRGLVNGTHPGAPHRHRRLRRPLPARRARAKENADDRQHPEIEDQERRRDLTFADPLSLNAATAANQVAEQAEAAVSDAKAEAAAAGGSIDKTLDEIPQS
jgi:hypothetical protein